jgi:hypothetical protein
VAQAERPKDLCLQWQEERLGHRLQRQQQVRVEVEHLSDYRFKRLWHVWQRLAATFRSFAIAFL